MAQAGNGDSEPGESAGQASHSQFADKSRNRSRVGRSNKKQSRAEPSVETKGRQTQQDEGCKTESTTESRKQSGHSAITGGANCNAGLEKLDYQSLNRFYEERAGNVTLEGEFTSQNLEILAGSEDADPSSLSKLRLSSSFVLTRPDGSLYLSLKKRWFPLPIDSHGGESVGSLPDLCFVFDSSGSMNFQPSAEKGEYHIALLTFYSILRGLEAKGLASLLRFNALNFSDTTFASDWRPYYEIEAVKRVLLQHQGGGTTIDVEKLAAIRHERKDNYLLFLLSDLDISNVAELEAELIETYKSRTAHVLIFKLGGKNLLCTRLEEAGMNIFYPSTAADFMNGSIKIARTVYSGAL